MQGYQVLGQQAAVMTRPLVIAICCCNKDKPSVNVRVKEWADSLRDTPLLGWIHRRNKLLDIDISSIILVAFTWHLVTIYSILAAIHASKDIACVRKGNRLRPSPLESWSRASSHGSQVSPLNTVNRSTNGCVDFEAGPFDSLLAIMGYVEHIIIAIDTLRRRAIETKTWYIAKSPSSTV
jgi:hypothetical protein